MKSLMIIKCLLISLIIFSCGNKNKVEDVNVPKQISKEFEVVKLDSCELLTQRLPNRLSISVEHESCELSNHKIAFLVDYKCVYYGMYSNPVIVPLDLCQDKYYQLKIVIVDEENGYEYWWQNKRTYNLSKFDQIVCTLFDSNNFDDSNGVEFDVKFK